MIYYFLTFSLISLGMNLFFISVIKKQKREIKELDAQIEPDWPSPLRQQGTTEEEREMLKEIAKNLFVVLKET